MNPITIGFGIVLIVFGFATHVIWKNQIGAGVKEAVSQLRIQPKSGV